MAKWQPIPTEGEIGRGLGYHDTSFVKWDLGDALFYSDLHAAPKSRLDFLRRELIGSNAAQDLCSAKTAIEGSRTYENTCDPQSAHLDKGSDQSAMDYETLRIVSIPQNKVYNNICHLHLTCGFDISLLLTQQETQQVRETARLVKLRSSSVPTTSLPPFANLPPELRLIVYEFILIDQIHERLLKDGFAVARFLSGLGDPSGFYTPFDKEITILHINRMTRQEALPLVFRQLVFTVDSIENVVRLLIAIGRVGRDNIASIDITWTSYSDVDRQRKADDGLDPALQLPDCHVLECINLLQDYRNLKILHLRLEEDLLKATSNDQFKCHKSIQQLCRLRSMEDFDVLDIYGKPMTQYAHVQWLKQVVKLPCSQSRIAILE